MLNAHQPYFYGKKLYHCKRLGGDWKPYIGSKKIDFLSRFKVVCSLVPSDVGCSFVANTKRNNSYSLFYRSNSDLIVQLEKKSCFGCANSNIFVCQKNYSFNSFYLNLSGSLIFTPINFTIWRVVPVEINEDWLLVSGTHEKKDMTLVYDFKHCEWLGMLQVAKSNVYKSCLSTLGCHYAVKNGKDFEDREIKFSSSWSVEKL